MTLADMQAVSDLTAEFIKISTRPIVCIVDNTDKYAARADIVYKNINVTKWVSESNENYILAVIAHEVCHFLPFGVMDHGYLFHFYERLALEQWGMVPVYKGIKYIKELRKLDGKLIHKISYLKEKEFFLL